MSQHHDGRQQHGSWVSGVLVLQIETNVTATLFTLSCQQKTANVSHSLLQKTYGFKHGKFATNVAAWNQAWTTNQTSTLYHTIDKYSAFPFLHLLRGTILYHIRDDVTVEVRHNHDVKLLGTRDQLHGRVVDNHIIELNAMVFVLFGNVTAGAQKETISQFPVYAHRS